MERRCEFWLPKKKRFCANLQLNDSPFCGNHTTRLDGKWIPCPVDPSHNVLEENLKGHVKRCPFVKLANNLSSQPFYQKAINAGNDEDADGDEQDVIITSLMKRNAVYGLTSGEASRLISKIKSVHASICKDIQDSYKIPEACNVWIHRQIDQKLPFQEKHVQQQASILGNLEEIGAFKNNSSCNHSQEEPAVVEFGAGRGYLTQMLADCYGIKKVYLVERKSYKLKADRSLRQIDSMVLERLRIDIEDLNLDGVESLKGTPYLAIGKHLCGPATDMTLRCCLSKEDEQGTGHCYPKGVAIATCCHYLCQWKHYIGKSYMKKMGISKDEFNAITWFTSWAVDADHSSDLPDGVDYGSELEIMCSREYGCCSGGAEIVFGELTPTERAILGFLCKDIIDMGRFMWVKDRVTDARLVRFVPSHISPENRLLIAIANAK